MKQLWAVNKILLGLTMLIPGLLKLFVAGPAGVTGMLSGIALFSWAPAFWAWVLIIGEIVFGIAILANYKVNWASYGAALVLFIATITLHIKWSALGTTGWSTVLVHLVVVVNYLILATHMKKMHK